MAEAINVAEPVTMARRPRPSSSIAARCCPPSIRVVEISSRRRVDARRGPDLRASTAAAGWRGVDWRFNAWGGLEGGLYFPLGPRRPGRTERPRGRGRRSLPRADRARGRRDPRGRRGDGPDHRGVPAQPEPQSTSSRASRSRPILFELPRRGEDRSGSGAGCTTTRPTGMSTTSPASCGPASCCSRWTDDESDPQHAISRDALDASGARDGRPRQIARGGAHPLAGTAEPSARTRRSGVRACRREAARAAPVNAWPRPTSNFYLGDGRIVFPLLDERFDAAAEEVLKRLLSRA